MDSQQVQNLKNSIVMKTDQIEAILNGRDISTLDGDESMQVNRLMSQVEVIDLRLNSLPTSSPIFDLGGGFQSRGKVFKTFSDQISAIVRAGRGQEVDSRLAKVSTEYRAATGLSELVPAEGGFLLEPTYSNDILMSAYGAGNIIKLVKTIPIGTQQLFINAVAETSRATGSRWGGITGYWTNEAGAKTPSKPTFRRMELSLKKMIGLCYSTDELLADAATLESVLRQGFSDEITFMVEEAIFSGTGVGSPLGIMNSGALVSITRAGANAIAVADLVNMWSRIIGGANAVWLVHSTCLPQIYQLQMTLGATTSSPVFLPAGGLSSTPYSSIFGRPLLVTEHNAALGSKGDVLLVDLSQYVLATHSSGLKTDSSIHVRFVNDETCFRSIKQAAYVSNDICNSSLIRGNLNSKEHGNPEPSKGFMPWACVEAIQEPTYLN
jgi:HK97 family phage major capsid protein